MNILRPHILIKTLAAIALVLVFLAYLKPDLMVTIANTVLTLCGW
ncbi:MAG: hypothetical protein ACKOXE_05175 [Polynucleobacter victoriensis]